MSVNNLKKGESYGNKENTHVGRNPIYQDNPRSFLGIFHRLSRNAHILWTFFGRRGSGCASCRLRTHYERPSTCQIPGIQWMHQGRTCGTESQDAWLRLCMKPTSFKWVSNGVNHLLYYHSLTKPPLNSGVVLHLY